MDFYEMVFRVPVDKVTTVTAVLSPEVQLTSCRLISEETPLPVKRKKYAGGKRFKGILASDLVLKALQDGKRLTVEEVSKVLTSHEPPFAETTAATLLYQMRTKGLIIRDDETNRWFLIKKKR